jgi:hypothetical protein
VTVVETVRAVAFAAATGETPAAGEMARQEADATASGAAPIGATALGLAIRAGRASRIARAAGATTSGAEHAGPAADGDAVSLHSSSNANREAHQTVIAIWRLS